MMRYAVFDIDVAHPMSDLLLSPGDAGAAILVRRKSVPIGFWMQEASGAACVSADALAQRISAELGMKIVAETIREGMTTSSASAALPAVTVAICTHDRTEHVERLLRSLRPLIATMPEGSGQLELVLVDNAPSDDRTRDLAKQWPEVRYVHEPRTGLNFARNRALLEARGEILASLDDDVIPDHGWLAGLADACGANRDAAAFTGRPDPSTGIPVAAIWTPFTESSGRDISLSTSPGSSSFTSIAATWRRYAVSTGAAGGSASCVT
jgi:hypothetical protein